MQSSERKAWMPRSVSNALAQATCDQYNSRVRMHPKANPETGIVNDQTGNFIVEVRKKRVLKHPRP